MKLKFTKMHGCGNDYIFFDCFTQPAPENPEALSVRLSDRNFGIGGDGIVLILPPESGENDARMRIFNADGSEAMMCGNATRCIGKYLYERGYVKTNIARLETNSGVKILTLYPDDGGEIKSVRVNMGRASLDPAALPALVDGERVVGQKVALSCGTHKITLVSMGNPHCVLFESPELVAELGPSIERDPIFPHRVNVEFVEVTGENELRMRVWERGSGETLACGTGACAAAVAAVECGLCDGSKSIVVALRGGELSIEYTPDAVYMTGPAEIVFEGEVEL
ncbi:MAG: diaminopimelate epimerase [Clostridiales bacterium]|nr:diaminopimelate epimerase [Clostridiales bacterium]